MEQIQELLELLKQTPEMALWGISIYFLFILLKMASWVGAITLIAKLFINKYFAWKDKKEDNERIKRETEVELVKSNQLIKQLESSIISGNSHLVHQLFLEMKNLDTNIKTNYVHRGGILKTIELIKNYKKENEQ